MKNDQRLTKLLQIVEATKQMKNSLTELRQQQDDRINSIIELNKNITNLLEAIQEDRETINNGQKKNTTQDGILEDSGSIDTDEENRSLIIEDSESINIVDETINIADENESSLSIDDRGKLAQIKRTNNKLHTSLVLGTFIWFILLASTFFYSFTSFRITEKLLKADSEETA